MHTMFPSDVLLVPHKASPNQRQQPNIPGVVASRGMLRGGFKRKLEYLITYFQFEVETLVCTAFEAHESHRLF